MTSERIRRASRKLFARRGVDGVSVRQVVAEAGARNNGSIHYYFGSKDALVRELVMEGAHAIDDYRRKALDELEQRGASVDVRAIVAILVESMINEADERLDGYARFLAGVRLNRRHLANNPLEGRWSAGTRRCYAHLERMLPAFAPAVLLLRFNAALHYITAALAERESVLDSAAGADPQPGSAAAWWGSREAIDDVIDTATALLTAPARIPAGSPPADWSAARPRQPGDSGH
ncbi:TetR/AcrR family transcriptional regulator [Camelimonas abortus]|uniref:TetR/AcrR family transcriptional regulator n=1 Tax=Camelimonas abortus TaxID=1017184 RepID=A0ABV7LE22_9HYPH